MNKKILLTLALLAVGTVGFCAQQVNQLRPVTNLNLQGERFSQTNTDTSKNNDNKAGRNTKNSKNESKFDTETIYYPNANINSAISKYKRGNYTGCLQELFSLVKKQPNNSKAYYYMALAYANIGMQSEAVEAYEKVMELSPGSYIAQYAEKGKDCLTGGPMCNPQTENTEGESVDELDQFINAPYGNGLSPELDKELKEKQLENIKKQINKDDDLNQGDINKIRDFDKKNNENYDEQSYGENETVKIAQVSDEEVLKAINTLKEAGVTVTVSTNPYSNGYQDSEMAQLSMMLGNNNYNNGSMMNMMPMLMAQNQEGKNIDPRLIQAMMMNSMVTDFTFSDNKDRY